MSYNSSLSLSFHTLPRSRPVPSRPVLSGPVRKLVLRLLLARSLNGHLLVFACVYFHPLLSSIVSLQCSFFSNAPLIVKIIAAPSSILIQFSYSFSIISTYTIYSAYLHLGYEFVHCKCRHIRIDVTASPTISQ